MTTTAERRRLRRRIGSVIGLVLVAFGVGYLLWAHATLTLRHRSNKPQVGCCG